MGKYFSWRGGIHPQKFKENTMARPIARAKVPLRVAIPLSQHIGAGCISRVNVGDSVKVGTLIGESEAKVSSRVHASISGVVKEITKYPHPTKGESLAVIIEGDGRDEKEPFTERREENVNALTPLEVRALIRNAGIVGLGGACFPTHIKLTPLKKIDSIIINGAECEPYLTCDYRLMLEKTDQIIKGLKILMKLLEVRQAFIGIEDDKPLAIKAMKEACRLLRKSEGSLKVPRFGQDREPDNNPSSPFDIKIVELKAKYPQGGEKQLIKTILNREVPSGGLPFDIGVVNQNVGTVFAIYEAVYGDKPLYERTVTVGGGGIKNPANLLLRIGTPISDLIDQCGGLVGKPYKVVIGGPMMGVAQYSLEVPVVKGTSGILFFSKEETVEASDQVCIKCARCSEACPIYIIPFQIARLSRKKRWAELAEYNIKDCIECGCCDYVCPARIPLVQLIKLGKANI